MSWSIWLFAWYSFGRLYILGFFQCFASDRPPNGLQLSLTAKKVSLTAGCPQLILVMKKCAVTGGETKLTLALIKAWCHWQGASTDMMIKTRDLLYCLKPLWYFFWSHTIIQYQAIYFELSRTTICRFALTCQVPIETTAQTFFEWMWFDTGDLQDSRYLSWRCQTNYCSPPGSLLTSDREVRVLFFWHSNPVREM